MRRYDILAAERDYMTYTKMTAWLSGLKLNYPTGADCYYGYAFSYYEGVTNYFLTDQWDKVGRRTRYYYTNVYSVYTRLGRRNDGFPLGDF